MNNGARRADGPLTLDSLYQSSRSVAWTLLGFGLAMIILANFFPRSGDDWAWGSSIGLERLDTWFEGYNGRYLGNFAVLGLTRAQWLVPVSVAITLCLVVWLIASLAGQRDVVGLFATAALMIGMPLAVWQQSIVWVAGFSNYALGSTVLLAFMCSIRNDLERRRLHWTSGVLLCAFSVGGQLFIEHVTIFIVLMSLALLGVRIVHPKMRITARTLIWAVGSVVGAAVMFSNSAYWRAATSDSQYQQLGGPTTERGSTVASLLAQGTGGVSQLAIAINTTLNGALFVLLLGLTLTAHRHHPIRVAQVLPMAFAGVGLVTGAAVSASVEMTHVFGSLTRWAWVPALSLFVALLLSARYLITERRRSRMIFGLCLAVLVLIAPMAMVTPYGPRNFLPSYVLVTAIAVVLLAELRARCPSPTTSGVALALSLTVLGAAFAGYATTYSMIHHAADQRLDAVRAAVQQGRNSVRVLTLPNPGYVHAPDPTPGVWQQRYKLFYGIPPDFEIRLIDRYARADLRRPR